MSYIGLAALLATAHVAGSRSIKVMDELPEIKEQTASTVLAPIIIAVAVGIIWIINVPSIAQASKLVTALGRSQKDPAETLVLFKEAVAEKGLGTQEVSEQLMTFATGMRSRSDVSTETRANIVTTALTQMEKQVAETPDDARLRVQLATGLRGLGQYEKALEESEKALALSPKKQTIMIERGFEFWEADKISEARDIFRKMYDLDPSFIDLAAYAAAGEIAVGNRTEGEAILMKAYGTTIVDSEVLVVAYYQAKRYDDLVAVLKLRLTNKPSAEGYLRLASAYAVSGRMIEARVTAQTALQKYPESAKNITAFMSKLP